MNLPDKGLYLPLIFTKYCNSYKRPFLVYAVKSILNYIYFTLAHVNHPCHINIKCKLCIRMNNKNGRINLINLNSISTTKPHFCEKIVNVCFS